MTDDPHEPESIENYLTRWDYQRQHNTIMRQGEIIKRLGGMLEREGEQKDFLARKIMEEEEGSTPKYTLKQDPVDYLIENYPRPHVEKVMTWHRKYTLVAAVAALAVGVIGAFSGYLARKPSSQESSTAMYALDSKEFECSVTGNKVECTTDFKEKKMGLCQYSLNGKPLQEVQLKKVQPKDVQLSSPFEQCQFSADLEEKVNVLQFFFKDQQGWHFAAWDYKYSRPVSPAPAPAPAAKAADTQPSGGEGGRAARIPSPPTVSLDSCDVRDREGDKMKCQVTPRDNGSVSKLEYRYGTNENKGKWESFRLERKLSTNQRNSVYLPIREGPIQVRVFDNNEEESPHSNPFNVEVKSLPHPYPVLDPKKDEYPEKEGVKIKVLDGLTCSSVSLTEGAPKPKWDGNVGTIESLVLSAKESTQCSPGKLCKGTYNYIVLCTEANSQNRIYQVLFEINIVRGLQ